MKRLHLFLLILCSILVIVYFGIKSTHEPFAQCGVQNSCTTSYDDHIDLNIDTECPEECPVCTFTPPEGGSPVILYNNPLEPDHSNNKDNSKHGMCTPDRLYPANDLITSAQNPSGVVDVTLLENMIAIIAATRFLIGPIHENLNVVNFLGFYLLLMQGLNLPQPTQLLTDTRFNVTVTEDGTQEATPQQPTIPEGNPNPPLTIPNVLQLPEANIDPTQQVAVNFPGVLGDAIMLPMIPIIQPNDQWRWRGGGPPPNFLNWAIHLFNIDNINMHDALRLVYNEHIQPAITQLLQALTPTNYHNTVVKLPLARARQRLALAAGGMARVGSQSSLQLLPPDLIEMIGMMPTLNPPGGVFRVNFQYNRQTTNLQTVIRQALDNPTIRTNLNQEMWELLLEIVNKFVTLQFYCSGPPSGGGGGSPSGGGSGGGSGGTGGASGGITV